MTALHPVRRGAMALSEKVQGRHHDRLVLQLSFPRMASPVACFGDGLVDAAPQRPAEEVLEGYAGGELQAADEMADLARAGIDRRSRPLFPLWPDVAALSLTRKAARKAKASMARVMCRYQPCQERIS